MTVELMTVFSVVLICVCGALLFFIVKGLLGIRNHQRSYSQKDYAKDHAFIQNGYFNAASDILRETARHRYGGNTRR